MSVVELRCPGCGAPVEGGAGQAQRCPYCNASLVVGAPSAGVDTHEEHFVTIEAIGPSNRERIVALLATELDLEPAAVATIVGDLPADVGGWKRAVPAAELSRLVADNGGVARVGVRIIETARLLARDVMLDDAGPKLISVIKIVRARLVLGLREAKELVDSAPCRLARGLDGARAEALRAELAAVGATVRLV